MLAVAAIPIAPKPTTVIVTSATGNRLTTDVTSSATPRTIAPTGMITGRERPENAIPSAATSEPMPVAAMRKPKPVASVSRTSRASVGITTPKFIANSDTIPTVTVASRTRSLRRT